MRMEKQKSKMEDHQEWKEAEHQEDTTKDEEGAEEPSYLQTVQQVKRRRKQKGRQRQKVHSHATRKQLQSGEEHVIDPHGLDRGNKEDTRRNEDIPETLTPHESVRNAVDEGDSDDDHGFFSVPNCQFAALALTEDDSVEE